MFNNLPEELKLEVLGNSDLNTVLKLRLVSKGLEELTSDRYLWNTYFKDNFEITVPLNTEPEMIEKALCSWYYGIIEILYTDNYIGSNYDFSRIKRITDCNKRIDLNLSHCHGITDVSNLGNVHDLNLSNCRGITDVSNLGNVHDLNLSYCDGITDLSNLGNVRILNLSCCQGITDVSNLGNVHDLNLWNCRGITDVSNLGNVRNLNLYGCQGITDVSDLGNVKKLTLPDHLK
jgi:hypothetical protein